MGIRKSNMKNDINKADSTIKTKSIGRPKKRTRQYYPQEGR